MTAWHVYVNVQYCCRYARYSLTPTLTTLSCPRLRACTRQTASATISCLASGQQNMPCDQHQRTTALVRLVSYLHTCLVYRNRCVVTMWCVCDTGGWWDVTERVLHVRYKASRASLPLTVLAAVLCVCVCLVIWWRVWHCVASSVWLYWLV